MAKATVTPQVIEHIASLAQIPVSKTETGKFAEAFTQTLAVVEELREPDTSATPPTHQVTGLENVWRDDVVEPEKMFSQTEALANGAQVHEGYFVVPRVLEEKDT